MRAALLLTLLALAACGPEQPRPEPAPVPPPASPQVDECGHRECGQIGYGFGYNMRSGTFGLGFGSGGINYF
ncbi:hypothetical protein [Brevundimonas phage AA]|jgi:hypothetical protein|uniref:Lipoprotein n=1 Tax=Brevundimonas phage AA TaxID=2880937 RepID=A0AAN0MNN0_9CAUD|nr:hypothetical protein [Brevundimonas phage BC]UCR90866.1 hypothetical protein [Brevundimonas phage AA]